VLQISAVPFHMWTPDVYEGAPPPSPRSSPPPKIAGIAMFVRTTNVALPGIVPAMAQIVVFVAIARWRSALFAAIASRNINA